MRMIRLRSSPFRLQHFVRGGCARAFAQAMAVLLFLMNFSAWAMPVPRAAEGPATQAMASSSTHRHCSEAATKMIVDTERSGLHDIGDPCCTGGACACLHSGVGIPASLSPGLAPAAAVQSTPPPEASLVEAIGDRRLRPPIA